MQQQNRLYVHCGFHKTGSTALQAALRASEAPLREAGFLYPYAGSYDRPGKISFEPDAHVHRNIGFELDRHWQFDTSLGTISDLADECKTFSGNIIISVEGLESALAEPGNFSSVLAYAHSTGRRLTLIVYLRNQLSYCESLYLELLKHRTIDEYRRHACEILETGCLRNYETLHHFNYEQLLQRWVQVDDIDVVVRNYHLLEGGSITTDFAKLLGMEKILRARSGEETVHSRASTQSSLDCFYADRIQRKLTLVEKRRIELLANECGQLTSSTTLQRKFVEKFRESNLRLCETWDIPIKGLDMQDIPKQQSDVTLEQFFSFETHCAIRTGAIPDTRFAPADTRDTSWMAGIETAAANIPLAETLRYRREKLGQARRWYTKRIKTLLSFTATPNSR